MAICTFQPGFQGARLGHASFVESLEEAWNIPMSFMDDFDSSEISLSEISAINDMDLPLITTGDLFNKPDAFNYVNSILAMLSYGDDSASGNIIAVWRALDENTDIFSQDADIFSNDNQS